MNFKIAAVIAATTLGAGMFALPYVFQESGWFVGIFYLVVLSAAVIWTQIIYWQTLAVADKKGRLLGLTRAHLGNFGYYAGSISILAGLVLALVIYLILGNQFIKLFWLGVNGTISLFSFWFISVLPLLFTERRVLWFETMGVFFMAAIIFLIFFSALPGNGLNSAPLFDVNNLFLPFGVILFSLAGWTAIEPLYRDSRAPGAGRMAPVRALSWGVVSVALLYLLFTWGIFSSAPVISTDTVSGLYGWPNWKLALLGILGLFALWTSYMPIALEIKNALAVDLNMNPRLSLYSVVFTPLILVIIGLSSFLKVIGLAGGVFLGLQYVLIILVGKKVLQFSGGKKFLSNLLIAVFLLAAVYEVYYFAIG